MWRWMLILTVLGTGIFVLPNLLFISGIDWSSSISLLLRTRRIVGTVLSLSTLLFFSLFALGCIRQPKHCFWMLFPFLLGVYRNLWWLYSCAAVRICC